MAKNVGSLAVWVVLFLVAVAVYLMRADREEPQLIGVPVDASFPYQAEGRLEISVEEGEVGPDGLSAINFGALVTAEGTYLVSVDADLLRAAGWSRDELVGRPDVRVELASADEQFTTPPTYAIATIQAVSATGN